MENDTNNTNEDPRYALLDPYQRKIYDRLKGFNEYHGVEIKHSNSPVVMHINVTEAYLITSLIDKLLEYE